MNKIKILMMSDHPMSPTGVGTQARWLIDGLIRTGKYTFRCFGGAVKHERYDVIRPNDDLVIRPVDGFGDQNLLRQTLMAERPDVLMLFTDPRFFIWVWEMADEIHTICPIAYNHLWDCDPYPTFNEPFYRDTDLINCINKPTYDMLHQRFPGKVNFAPHAVPQDLYHPEPDYRRRTVRGQLLNVSADDHFVALWIGRNARRKRPNDMLVAWSLFVKQLPANANATLIMHTNPRDGEGPNLLATATMLGIERSVKFSPEVVGFEHMRALYAASDVVINTSMNEGFGVPTLEAMYCGKPIIVPTTGGLTHQAYDAVTGMQTGIALEPDVRTLTGGQMVPFIYEDLVKNERFAGALREVFEWGPAKRAAVGAAARTYALREFSMERLIGTWDVTLRNLTQTWRPTHTNMVIR
jgi:glycosyltransferase involved in cell wall biosynthesis